MFVTSLPVVSTHETLRRIAPTVHCLGVFDVMGAALGPPISLPSVRERRFATLISGSDSERGLPFSGHSKSRGMAPLPS